MTGAPAKELTQTGYLIIGPSGRILLDGFDAEDVSCRELALEAMRWARAQLDSAIEHDERFLAGIYHPEGFEPCALDFGPSIVEALVKEVWLNQDGNLPRMGPDFLPEVES